MSTLRNARLAPSPSLTAETSPPQEELEFPREFLPHCRLPRDVCWHRLGERSESRKKKNFSRYSSSSASNCYKFSKCNCERRILFRFASRSPHFRLSRISGKRALRAFRFDAIARRYALVSGKHFYIRSIPGI